MCKTLAWRAHCGARVKNTPPSWRLTVIFFPGLLLSYGTRRLKYKVKLHANDVGVVNWYGGLSRCLSTNPSLPEIFFFYSGRNHGWLVTIRITDTPSYISASSIPSLNSEWPDGQKVVCHLLQHVDGLLHRLSLNKALTCQRNHCQFVISN